MSTKAERKAEEVRRATLSQTPAGRAQLAREKAVKPVEKPQVVQQSVAEAVTPLFCGGCLRNGHTYDMCRYNPTHRVAESGKEAVHAQYCKVHRAMAQIIEELKKILDNPSHPINRGGSEDPSVLWWITLSPLVEVVATCVSDGSYEGGRDHEECPLSTLVEKYPFANMVVFKIGDLYYGIIDERRGFAGNYSPLTPREIGFGEQDQKLAIFRLLQKKFFTAPCSPKLSTLFWRLGGVTKPVATAKPAVVRRK
jgi:hypothetical protein